MGKIFGCQFCYSHYAVSPIRLAVPLAALSPQRTRVDVRHRLALRSNQSGFPLYKLWLRDCGPDCRISLYSHCLSIGHLHCQILANSAVEQEANFFDYLPSIGGVPGRCCSGSRATLRTLARPLAAISCCALHRTRGNTCIAMDSLTPRT